ncbi:RNA polymerase III RPC4-domain-containing protein [Massariosphaeria phaeospora]|uniref:RNA polymerase III RPC4-domain-containing protein n=1 Tax=Massariosphaeria phaeospora TaxID=100035 RepID=A0A7C8MBM4_9PLEO|nr:RNA polymerase III RPC4-domain-containing protein [Massariosphaeria phaeospora]
MSSPQTLADSPAQPSVPRLESLKSNAPSSRSASPSVRRGTSRGRKPTIRPTTITRRNKEEREAREKQDRDREKERNKERDAAINDKLKREKFRLNKQSSRSRGGYSGVVSGPFSLGSSAQDKHGSKQRFSGSGFATGSSSSQVRIKREDGPNTGVVHKSTGGTSVKREDGGYVSSEDEETEEFPRKDIDTIEVSSDEEERDRARLPVRIGRKEHHERTIGINTEASSDTAAKILQQAEASGKAPTAELLEGTSRKGKAKAKDVQSTDAQKPYKGVWQDDDESMAKIKAEPDSGDELMVDAEQVGLNGSLDGAGGIQAQQLPESNGKARTRIKSLAEPVLQTDEDRAEWRRFQSNMSHMRAELGPDQFVSVTETDGNSNIVSRSKQSVRDNNVYIFQIPPIMPELVAHKVKEEPVDAENSASNPVTKTEPTPVKAEPGLSQPSLGVSPGPRFASGLVGKLRVHESGRTTLDWGGTSYELKPGLRTSFLQELMAVDIVPAEQRVAEEDAGGATSYGRIKGKFIVVPDWDQMLVADKPSRRSRV